MKKTGILNWEKKIEIDTKIQKEYLLKITN